MTTKANKTESNATSLTSKQVSTTLKAVKSAAQTLNQCLKAFNGAIQKEDGTSGRSIWATKTAYGVTTGELFELMGLKLGKKGLTVGALKYFWKNEVCGTFGVYRNTPIKTKEGEKVYVPNKEGNLKPLTIYTLKAVAADGWTPAVICKGIEQNWCPNKEAKKAAESEERAQSASAYYVLREDEFIQVSKEEVEF